MLPGGILKEPSAGLWRWRGGPVLQGASTHSWRELAMLEAFKEVRERWCLRQSKAVDVSLGCVSGSDAAGWGEWVLAAPSSCPQAELPMDPPPLLG